MANGNDYISRGAADILAAAGRSGSSGKTASSGGSGSASGGNSTAVTTYGDDYVSRGTLDILVAAGRATKIHTPQQTAQSLYDQFKADSAKRIAEAKAATQQAEKEYNDYLDKEGRIYQKNYGTPSDKANELQNKLNQARLAQRDAENEATITRLAQTSTLYKDNKNKKSKVDAARTQTLPAKKRGIGATGIQIPGGGNEAGLRAKNGSLAWETDAYKAMTDDEVSVYNRLAKNGKEKEAEDFLKAITPTLNARVTQGRLQTAKETAQSGVGGGIGASVASSLLKPVTAAQGGIKTVYNFLAGKPIDTNAPEYYASNLANTLRSSVAEKIENGVYESTKGDYTYDRTGTRRMTTEGEAKNNGKIASFLYQTGMSMADMMVMIPFGSTGMQVMMSSNAGVDAMLDAKNNGATDEQAMGIGIVSAAAEAFFEKFSIENLFHGDVSASTVRAALKQGGIEASEEMATELTNILANEAIMGSQSDFNKAVAEYKAIGLDDKEAKAKALEEKLLQVLEAGAGGFLSGFGMGAVSDITRTNAATRGSVDAYLSAEFDRNDKTDYTKKATQEQIEKYKKTGMSEEDAQRAASEKAEVIKERAAELKNESKERYISNTDHRAQAEAYLKEQARAEGEKNTGIAKKVAQKDASLGRQVMANTEVTMSEIVDNYKQKLKADGFTESQIKKKASDYEKALEIATDNLQYATDADARRYWADKYSELVEKSEIEVRETTEKAEPAEPTEKELTKAERKVLTLESRIAKETAKLNGFKYKNGYEAMQIRERIKDMRAEMREWQNLIDQRAALDKAKNPEPITLPQVQRIKEEVKYDSAAKQIADNKERLYQLRKQLADATTKKEKTTLQKAIDNLVEQNKDFTIKTNLTAPIADKRILPTANNTRVELIKTESSQNLITPKSINGRVNETQEKGVVHDYERTLSREQTRTIALLNSFYKTIGRTVHIVENLKTDGTYNVKDENGKYITGNAQGLFNRDTGEYFISLDAVGEGYTYVAVHESVHDIAKNTPDEYVKLQDTVLNELNRLGYNTEKMAAERMERYGESKDVAYEEVIANTVPAILRDERSANQLVERILTSDKAEQNTFLRFIDTLKSYFDRAYNALVKTKSWAQMDEISKDAEAVERIREKYIAGLQAIKEQNNARQAPKENSMAASGIRASAIDESTQREIEKQIGTTYSWRETGYLTPSGKQLDFSGKKFGGQEGYRSMDHREVLDYMSGDAADEMSGTDAMVAFMRAGNIRISPESGGINLSVEPTPEQRSKLQSYIRTNHGEVTVDFDDANGDTVHSIEYPSGTDPVRVLNDIKRYFTEGVKPEISLVQQFRTSTIDTITEQEAQERYKGKDLSKDKELYDYDFLKVLPDISVTIEGNINDVYKDGKLDRREVVKAGMGNAESNGQTVDTKNGNNSVIVRNRYTGRDIRVTEQSIRHGIYRENANAAKTNARAGMVIGDLLVNALPINALNNTNAGMEGTYSMLAPIESADGKYKGIAMLTVETRRGELTKLKVYDQAHAVSVRKRSSVVQNDTATPSGEGKFLTATLTYTIPDFLGIVKSTHKSLLSENTLAAMGETKSPDGAFYESAKFSQKEDTTPLNARDLFKPLATDNTGTREIQIIAKGRNALEQSYIDEFNRTHKQITPAESSVENEYTTNKLPPEVNLALRNEKRIKRQFSNFKENTNLTEEQMNAIDALYKGGFTRGEAVQSLLNKFPTANKAEAEAYYDMFKTYTENQNAVSNFNKQRKKGLFDIAQKYTENAITWKDKKAGFQYARETMERNNFDIMSYAEAEAINKEYFAPVHENEANNTRWKKSLIKRMQDLKLNKWESKYVHMLINQQDLNNRMGGKQEGIENGLDWTNNEMAKLLKSHGQLIDVNKCNNAVPKVLDIFRDIYVDLTDAETRNGYAATEFYNTYAPNISDDSKAGFFERIAQSLGFEQGDMRLPTDLAGLTSTFKPGKPWFQYSLSRHSHQTAFDIHKAFDQYIRGAGNVIWHTDDIQRLRALETSIRYQFSNEGIRKQIREVMQDGSLDPDEQFERVQRLAGSGKNLGNYVSNLTEYTNLLAGKKSIHDRGVESDLGRAVYRIMNNVQGRVAGNVIGGNISVALSNFIPLTQALSGVRPDTLAKAMLDAGHAFIKDDGFEARSTFITNRRGTDNMYSTAMDRVNEVLSVPFEAVDRFVASTLVRARYVENIEQGMSNEEAMLNADTWAAGLIADRSKGALPTIFGRTNPIAKLFNMFQVESNNQLSYMFKDVPRETRQNNPYASEAQIATFVAGKLMAAFLAAFGYNKLREMVGLSGNAFDPISWIEEVYGEAAKYKSGEQKGYETAKKIVAATADQAPFVGSVLGGSGRYSVVQSALPSVSKILQAYEADQENEAGGEYVKSVLKKELEKPVYYYLLPTAGAQIYKTKEGIKVVANAGAETVNKKGETMLQFPIAQTPGNYVKAALLGKSTLPEYKQWKENGWDSLTPKQTEAFREYEKAGGDIMTFTDYQKQYKELTAEAKKTNDEISELYKEIAAANPMLSDAEAKERAQKQLGKEYRNAENEFMLKLQNSDMTEEQKLAAISSIGLSDDDISTIKGLMKNGITVSEYLKYDNLYRSRGSTKTEDKNALVSALMADKTLSEKDKTMLANKLIDGDWEVDFSSQAANDILTQHGKSSYNKYQKAKAEAGISAETYLSYANKSDNFISDYDQYGTSISYSKKAKVVDYLEKIDASEEQKEYMFQELFGYTSSYQARFKKLKEIDGVWCYEHNGEWIRPTY